MNEQSLLAVAGVTAAGAAGISAMLWPRSPGELRTRELLIGESLTKEQVESFLTHVATGAHRHAISVVVEAHAGRTRWYLCGEESSLRSLGATWEGLVPGARVEAAALAPTAFITAARLRARGSDGRWPLLSEDNLELSARALLSACQPVGTREHVRVVVRLRPAPTRRPATSNDEASPLSARSPVSASQARGVRAKYGGAPLLLAEVVVAARSIAPSGADHHRGRELQLVRRVTDVVRSRQGLRGRLTVQHARGERAERWVRGGRRWTPTPRIPLTPREAASLVGLPIGTPAVDGVSYRVAPKLATPPNVPRFGRVWGVATNDKDRPDRPVAQPLAAALHHSLVIGPTGSGKSTLLLSLITQCIEAGRGCLILDNRGDLAYDLLARVPKDRRDQVLVLDPAAGGKQPGLRAFSRSSDPDLTADLILGTFKELWPEQFGVRSAQYLRLALATAARVPSSTLLDLPGYLTNAAERRRVLSQISDPLLLGSWQRFEALSAADQATHVAPALTKLEELLSRPAVRHVLGQPAPKLHFPTVLARGVVVVARLPAGQLGSPAARLLSALTLWQAFSAIEARAALTHRPTFEIFLDELGALGALPLPLAALLERARGLGGALTLAPQAMSQLPNGLRDAILANVGTVASFRLRAPREAALLTDRLPGISAAQLQALDPYEIALQLQLDAGAMSPVVTARTLPPSQPLSDPREMAAHAGERWGTTLAEVDESFANRHGHRASRASHDGPDERVGTRRRSA